MAKIYIEKEKDNEDISICIEGNGIELGRILRHATIEIIKRISREDIPLEEVIDGYTKMLRIDANAYYTALLHDDLP